MGLGGHVFNSVRFGGYLMLVGIPTFVDGRADLFGDAFLQRYVAAWSAVGGWLPELLDRHTVAWTLLEPQSPAAGLLDHLPGWERVYADPRRDPPAAAAAHPRRCGFNQACRPIGAQRLLVLLISVREFPASREKFPLEPGSDPANDEKQPIYKILTHYFRFFRRGFFAL
jgi:hypothetical protein